MTHFLICFQMQSDKDTSPIGLILGVSGAGKTSLAKQTAEFWPIFHAVDASSFLTEHDRNHPLKAYSQNQSAIADGVQNLRKKLPRSQIILLTAHALIETSTELILIKTNVFRDINPSFIFLQTELPSEISRRRKVDSSGKKTFDVNKIESIQRASNRHSKEIAIQLSVPLIEDPDLQKIKEIFDTLIPRTHK